MNRLEVVPPFAGDDQQLLERASILLRHAPIGSMKIWSQLAQAEGIDLATAALYQHLRTAWPHREFIRSIEASHDPEPAGPPPRIVIMPGAFHAEHPHTGADGARVCELAGQLGWSAERVPVPSLGSMQGNAEQLVQHLCGRSGQPIILVSLSKGGADVRAALQRRAAESEFRDVLAWVNISGMASGTPLVAWLRSRPLRCLGARLLLRLRGQRFAQIDELRHGAGSSLAGQWTVPRHLRVIHLLGFPLMRHLSFDWAVRGHARLAPLGPNDGGGILLQDALSWPGDVYPVWGADHYLRPQWDIRPLLLRILREAAMGATQAVHPQARVSASP